LFPFSALLFQRPDLDQLDQLAKSKDVAGLTQYLAAVPNPNPFAVFKTGGAYAAGRLGWKAKGLTTPDGVKYVVFSTPMIEEDHGELLFRVDGAGKLVFVPESDNLGVELDRHNFDIRFDLPNGKLIASDRIDCRWVDVRRRAHFVLRTSPTFVVSSITDLLGKSIPFAQAGGIVAVSPGDRPLRFVANYEGTTKMPAFDRQISPREATLSGSVWYLSIARRPAPYDITIRSPKDWTALAQGNLVSTAIEGDERVTKFHNALPVCWYGASAGPYKTIVDKIDGREYAVMSTTLTDAEMHLQNYLNSEVVDFYSKQFVPYPYKRWTALDSWQFHGGPGALEAYSFATYPGGLPGPDSHETSHTWWGGILNNNYLKSLWNESFAVFCSGLYARNQRHGKTEELAHAYVSVSSPFAAYNMAPLSDSGVHIGPAAAALGYGKGAYVLQMLEDDMGTETMIRCMREWIKTNPDRHIGSWEDLEKVVNKVSRQDYTWFFDQWVRRPGYADPALERASWSNGSLTGAVKFKGDVYRLRTDVLIQFPNGTRRAERIDVVPSGTDIGEFRLKCDRPSLVSIDPWQKVLRQRNPEEQRITLERDLSRMKAYVDPAHADYLSPMAYSSDFQSVPTDLSNVLLIGLPDSTPSMKNLCETAGFEVDGHFLTYKGTKVDLDHGGAIAVVDLPDGKLAAVGMGKTIVSPNLGNARLLLFNEYGQILRAVTDPVMTGPLARAIES
jgi:hypothetical protein